LRFEILLIVSASSLGYLSGVLWVINTARRFVYWWNNLATIVVTIAVQVVFLMFSNLGTVRGVLTLQLYSVAAGLLVNILASIYGFARGPRKNASSTAMPEEVFHA
jgi:hypothetical protein